MGEAYGDLKFQKVRSHIASRASARRPSFFRRRTPDLVFASSATATDIPGNIAEDMRREAQVRDG
jgi:hypothetical protein